MNFPPAGARRRARPDLRVVKGSRAATMPAPKGYPFLGVLPRLAKNPAEYTTRVMEEYGSPARLDLGLASVYLVTHPDHVEHVLVNNTRNYWKGAIFNGAKPVFGDGLILNEGTSWLHQRRLMQPAFIHSRMQALVSVMAEVVQRKLTSWQEAERTGQPLEMWTEMMTLTSDILIRTMFTLGISDEERLRMSDAFHAVFEHIDYRFLAFFLPQWVPLPKQRAYERALTYINETVMRIIQERRCSQGEYNDLLAMLLEARDQETGEGMSDKQLRDELVTIFFGGYEATATGLAWVWHLLAQHPDVERRFREEVRQVAGDSTPSFEDVGKLSYTSMVIQETLRLYPPFWSILRTAYSEDRIGGYEIPANGPLVLSPYATHRHPDFWENPEAFDPERFRPELAAQRPRYAYIPFGAGQRTCIGKHLALLEMHLILAMVAQAYELRPVPGHVVEPKVGHAVGTKDGILMTLHR